MQEGERLLPRSRRAGAGTGRMRVQGETGMGFSLRDFLREKLRGGAMPSLSGWKTKPLSSRPSLLAVLPS